MRRVRRMKRPKKELLDALPHDLIVEVVVHVVSESATPIGDITSLRATCKSFYEASKARKVGQRVAVKNEWRKLWWDKRGYFAFLGRCASSGNLEANFILGLEEVFSQRRNKSGLGRLLTAAGGGHHAAAYAVGMILFHDPATRPHSMELLNMLANGRLSDGCASTECTRSGSPHIARCRREVVAVLNKIMFKVPVADWFIPSQPCADPLCGTVITEEPGLDPWLLHAQGYNNFCSQLCRWKQEYHQFLNK